MNNSKTQVLHADCVTEPVSHDEAREFLSMIRAHRLYRRLSECFVSEEGNLLEQTPDDLAIAKIMLLDRIFREVRPTTIIEIGTHKAYFGLIAWLFCPSLEELVTFDINPKSETCAEILNEVLFTRFTLGNTKETFAAWTEGAELAWIDGGHWSDIPMHDIKHAMHLGIDVILIDDMDIPDVAHGCSMARMGRDDYEFSFPAEGTPVAMLRRLK